MISVHRYPDLTCRKQMNTTKIPSELINKSNELIGYKLNAHTKYQFYFYTPTMKNLKRKLRKWFHSQYHQKNKINKINRGGERCVHQKQNIALRKERGHKWFILHIYLWLLCARHYSISIQGYTNEINKIELTCWWRVTGIRVNQ